MLSLVVAGLVRALLAISLNGTEAQLQLPKVQYVIGGSSADSRNVFMEKFQPLFEDYLNDAVGSKFSPNISFKLVAVDYTPSTRAQDLVANGAVDFVCTLQLLLLKGFNF